LKKTPVHDVRLTAADETLASGGKTSYRRTCVDSYMHHQVLLPFETFPARLAREHLHPLGAVSRLHVPHHIPLGREQPPALAAREAATALAIAAAVAAAVAARARHCRHLAAQCGPQDLIQPAARLPSRAFPRCGRRGAHRRTYCSQLKRSNGGPSDKN